MRRLISWLDPNTRHNLTGKVTNDCGDDDGDNDI